jgi:plastocyanin domain-containing protein
MMRLSLKLLAFSSASLALVASPCLGTESAASKASQQTVELAITAEGTVPRTVVARSGQPVKLIITRKTDSTCVQQVVMKDFGVDKPLPLNTPVAVEFTPAKKGTYRLQCGMGMNFASVKVD